MTHDDELRSTVLGRVFRLIELLPKLEICSQQMIDTLGRIESSYLADVTAFPVDGYAALSSREVVEHVSVVSHRCMTVELVQSVERIGGWSHVEDGEGFFHILGHEEFDGMSNEEVDVFDKVEEVIPRSVLRGRGVICEVALH